MAKERSINPATAHQKALKTKALKKSKAALQTQRQAQLARRNPERLQREIDALKAEQEAAAGQLRPRDRQRLEQLERDVGAIRKAREREGAGGRDGGAAPSSERRGNRGENGARRGRDGGSALGKRRRDGGDAREGWRRGGRDSAEDETDEEVRKIPMPRDTPPPIPRAYHRRDGDARGEASVETAPETLRVPVPAKTTYAAAPQLRDLRKEATARFVPAVVARQLKAVKGEGPGGKLLEPEELEKLEEAGYFGKDGNERQRNAEIEEEEARFRKEMEDLRETNNSPGAEKRIQKDVSAVDHDVKAVVETAMQEAVHEMIADEAVEGNLPASRVDKHLRHVEIEEVEDEDW